MVKIDNVTVTYRPGSSPALSRLTLDIEGSALILGPSGAGKSTLLRALAGLVRPSQGEIWLDNVPLSRRPLAARRMVAYMPQENWLPREATLEEYLRELALLDGYPPTAVRQAVRDVADLVHLRSALPKRLKWLSGGMKRRALLAQALLRRTPWLVLDEPTLGLDPEEQASVRALVRHLSQHRRVIVATQFVEDASLVPDRVIIFRQGAAVAVTQWETFRKAAEGRVWRVPWTPAAVSDGHQFWAPEAGGKTVLLYAPAAAPEQEPGEPVPSHPEDAYLLFMQEQGGRRHG
ncbi:MAG: ATP-binding cassette domain-containing protein [Firmicutes bacterium]|nr:ATP-binding cassette domain-containing protein [Bacillota bacterium]